MIVTFRTRDLGVEGRTKPLFAWFGSCGPADGGFVRVGCVGHIVCFGATNPGTLYRTLRQMEKDGVVESSWETSRGGPARRMYAITGPGEACLGAWARSLERYQQSMDDFFELYGSKPPHADDNRED